jgi:lipopolysaccharide export system protein LptA
MTGGVDGVVLTQCRNVLKGDRLKVDMTTGVSRVEADGKVYVMIEQSSQGCESGPGGAKPASISPRIPAKK